MKKYNIFFLFVVENNGHKFICELDIYNKEYKEFFTQEKIEGNIEPLTKYFSVVELVKAYEMLDPKEPWMLTKKDILLKYLEINEKKYTKDNDIIVDIWQRYVETKKDNLPDIPIIRVKKLK